MGEETKQIDYEKAAGECKNLFGEDLKCQEKASACGKPCGPLYALGRTEQEQAIVRACHDACNAQLEACNETARQHMDSCMGNVICQYFNYVYGGGKYTTECAKYSAIVSKEITYPIAKWALEGFWSLIPDSLKAGAVMDEAAIADLVWPTYRNEWNLAVQSLESAWNAAREKAGLPKRLFCLETELVDALVHMPKPEGASVAPQMGQGIVGAGNLVATGYCNPGRLKVEQAITRWCAADPQLGGWGQTAKLFLSIDGETSGVGSIGMLASTYPAGDVVSAGNYTPVTGPFNLKFVNWRRFKASDEDARNHLLTCITSVWNARLASVVRAMIPLQAAIVMQVVADKNDADQGSEQDDSSGGPGAGTVLAVGTTAGLAYLGWRYQSQIWNVVSKLIGKVVKL